MWSSGGNQPGKKYAGAAPQHAQCSSPHGRRGHSASKAAGPKAGRLQRQSPKISIATARAAFAMTQEFLQRLAGICLTSSPKALHRAVWARIRQDHEQQNTETGIIQGKWASAWVSV